MHSEFMLASSSKGAIFSCLTIAVYGAVGAGLLAIALDLLPATFVTSAGNSPTLLEVCLDSRRILAPGVASGRGRGVGLDFDIVLVAGGLSIAGVVVVVFG